MGIDPLSQMISMNKEEPEPVPPKEEEKTKEIKVQEKPADEVKPAKEVKKHSIPSTIKTPLLSSYYQQ